MNITAAVNRSRLASELAAKLRMHGNVDETFAIIAEALPGVIGSVRRLSAFESEAVYTGPAGSSRVEHFRRVVPIEHAYAALFAAGLI